jgi:serine/threonine protein kinase
MARFERESKLLASLNHPNIAAIYGLEQADGKRFLVLELVDMVQRSGGQAIKGGGHRGGLLRFFRFDLVCEIGTTADGQGDICMVSSMEKVGR